MSDKLPDATSERGYMQPRLHESESTTDESSRRRTRVSHVISSSTLIKPVLDDRTLLLKGLLFAAQASTTEVPVPSLAATMKLDSSV